MSTAPCQTIAATIGELYTCSEVKGFVQIRTPYLYPVSKPEELIEQLVS